MENTLNPLALTTGELVKLLQRSGCREASDESLQKMVDAGLPLNGDGTASIVEFTAWLVKEVNGNGDEPGATQAV